MVQETNPRFAYCPKCSSKSFNSKDNGRSFWCEECHFNYYINNSAAVACLIFNDLGELLLTRRAFNPNKGMLDLPGGFVEPEESAEEAVFREIMEELNLEVTQMDYLVSFPNMYPFSGIVVPTVDLAFCCKVENFDQLKPDDDVASVEFIHPANIAMDDLCANSMRQIIHYYINSRTINNI
ncbi:MAG: NUDIX domain-containing protein [Prolixibacteraceae bacterium]